MEMITLSLQDALEYGIIRLHKNGLIKWRTDEEATYEKYDCFFDKYR